MTDNGKRLRYLINAIPPVFLSLQDNRLIPSRLRLHLLRVSVILWCVSSVIALRPSAAALPNIDPCAEAFEQLLYTPKGSENSAEAFEKRLLEFLRFAKWRTASSQRAVFFTIRSGFAYLPACTPRLILETSLYYPIGLLVRRLGEVSLLVGGRPRPYVFVLAEYGLPLLIPVDDLDELEKDKLYFFADAAKPTPYCLGMQDCKEDAGRVLHPRLRYAITERDADLLAQVIGGRCPARTIRITTFNRGARPTSEKAAFLNLCPAGRGTEGKQLRQDLRIVDFDWATDMLWRGVQGAFHRYGMRLLTLRKRPYLLRTKRCDEAIQAETSLSFDVRQLKVQNEMKTVQINLDPGFNVFVSNYAIQMPGTHGNTPDHVTLGYIFSVSTCDEFGPSAPKKVVFYNRRLVAGQFTFDFEAIRQEYTETHGIRGFIAFDGDPNALSLGKFFGILGADQYYFWRDVLRRSLGAIMRREPQPFEWRHKPDDVDAIVDFYVHLVMATNLHPLAPPRKSK